MENFVQILGARGSIPVSGPAYARYGGASTCFLICLGGQYILVDAGTGMLRLPEQVMEAPALSLLVTHPHLDHLQGLTMCRYLMKAGARLDVYGATRGGMGVEAQLRRVFSPPLWPVGVTGFPAQIRFFPIAGGFSIGSVRVEVMEGVHPGGVSLFRLSAGGKSAVIATDCTLTEDLLPKLEDIARDCDLLLCDGQYSEAEFPSRSSFGHSTWTAAARLGLDCGAKRTLVVHHDPNHTDEALDAAADELLQRNPRCGFAVEGERVPL